MVQIKNRITGLYDKKGMKCYGAESWAKKGHQRGAWGSVGQAKVHVRLYSDGYWSSHEAQLRAYMDSDFVIVDDDTYAVTTQPVSEYLIPVLKSEVAKRSSWDSIGREASKVIEAYKGILNDYDKE